MLRLHKTGGRWHDRRMREMGKALWDFCKGILSRFYFWGFALLLDPFDLYERFKPDHWASLMVPNWLGWFVLLGLLFWCAFLTYWEKWRNSQIATRNIEKFVSSRDHFTLIEAACLLAETDIHEDHLRGPAVGYLNDIRKMIYEQEIVPLNIEATEIAMMAVRREMGAKIGKNGNPATMRNDLEISKADLKTIADSRGIEIPGLT